VEVRLHALTSELRRRELFVPGPAVLYLGRPSRSQVPSRLSYIALLDIDAVQFAYFVRCCVELLM
jgi:hypothetical protein